MAKPSGLGKGLGALLGDDFNTPQSGTSTLPISQVEPFLNQPRKYFDQEALSELAESIRQHGVIQPLTVRKLSSGYYQIIAGERRWRAAKLAGLREIPVVMMEADDRTAMELAMIENLQREDLNPMEEAEGYRVLTEQYGMTQEQAASRVGKSRSAVANVMRLLNLTEPVRQLVEEGLLSAGHARALLPLSPVLQEKGAQTVLASDLNVRQTEALVKKLQATDTEEEATEQETIAPPAVDYVALAQQSLSEKMGRACHIKGGKKKGKVEIEYYDADDLTRLVDILEHTNWKSSY